MNIDKTQIGEILQIFLVKEESIYEIRTKMVPDEDSYTKLLTQLVKFER